MNLRLGLVGAALGRRFLRGIVRKRFRRASYEPHWALFRWMLVVTLFMLASCSRKADTPSQAEMEQVKRKLGDAIGKEFAAELDRIKYKHVNEKTPGPPKDATPDQLLPVKLAGFQRGTRDDKAELPDLGIAVAGHHARYESDGKRADIFIYRIADKEFETLKTPLHDRLKAMQCARLSSGSIEGKRWDLVYRLKERKEQGIFWCNKSWLVYVRSADFDNVGEVFDAYVDEVFIDGRTKKQTEDRESSDD